MKFLYLTIVFIIVSLGLFLLLSCIGLLGNNSYHDIITNVDWDIFGSVASCTVSTFVVHEEARRIKYSID